MAARPALPTKEALEDQARRLLETARGRSGASVEEMVKALGELQPRGAETRRSWYDWQERPETISLLTGLAAMRMLGREAAMELLFGVGAAADTGEPATEAADRLDHLQAALTEATAEMAELRERVEGFVIPEMAKQGELMSKMLADMQDAGIVTKTDVQERAPQGGRRTVGG
jgi:hypothetical protein